MQRRQFLNALSTAIGLVAGPKGVLRASAAEPAHPRVPPKVRDAITRALLELAGSEAGRQMLGRVPMAKPVATNMLDYLPMRQWGLDRYWVE